MKHIFDESTLAKIIETLVIKLINNSKINYCASVWSNTSDMNIKKNQLIQNWAARLITGLSKYHHISSTLESLNWLSMKEHLLYIDTILTFKCINGLAPSYPCDTFEKEMKTMTAIPGTIKSFKLHNIEQHMGKERSNIEQLRYGMRWMNN